MRKRLLHNSGLKLASLVLAFVLWFLVVQINDPLDSVDFTNVEIKLINTELLDREGKVYEVTDDTNIARVTVYAPKSVIGQIRKTDIIAEADVSKLTDINTIAVNYYVDNVAVDAIEGNREVVSLNVEEKDSKWIRLVSNVVGQVPEGYMVAGVSLDQTNIEITGPRSVVSQVSYAAVEVSVNGATSNLSANIDIQLYDSEDELVESDNVKKNVNSAHMTVEVLAKKDVPIVVEYQGIPGEGYMATGVAESDVRTVTLAGRPAVLDNIDVITIPAEVMDITGMTENLVEIVNLADYLPESIRWANKSFNGRVTATVHVEPIVTAEIEVPAGNINAANVPEGFVAEFSEDVESYMLTISGLAADMELVIPENILGLIDVQGYFEEQEIETIRPGNYEIPILFNLSEKITAETEVMARISLKALEE